jgi:hypothetical protein
MIIGPLYRVDVRVIEGKSILSSGRSGNKFPSLIGQILRLPVVQTVPLSEKEKI